MEPALGEAAAWDLKSIATTASLIVSPLAAFAGLLFNLLNWLRTGAVDDRVNANNRATRFEAVHGVQINQALSELRSITRHISTSRIALTSLKQAKELARTELNPKITVAESILIHELGSLTASKISANPALWKEACDNSLWDKVRSAYHEVLTATSIDTVTKSLDALAKHITNIVAKLQKARENENSIPD